MDKLTSFLIITSAILIALGVLGAIYNGGGIFPVIVYALLILGLGSGGND